MLPKKKEKERSMSGKRRLLKIALPEFCIPFFSNGNDIAKVFKEFESKSEARDTVKIYFYYLEQGIDLFCNFQDVEDEPYFGYCESLGMIGNVYTCYFATRNN